MAEAMVLTASLAGLLIAVELALRGAESLAVRFGISQAVIGLTIVAFGTDLPELAITIKGALKTRAGEDSSELILGNAIGSSTAQLMLIGGLAAMSGGLATVENSLRRRFWLMPVSAVILYAVIGSGHIDRITGAGLLVSYAASVFLLLKTMSSSPGRNAGGAAAAAGMLAAGLGGVIFFAHYTVLLAVGLAENYGVSQATIGLLVLGPGSSLPELVVSLWAAFRRLPALSLGNIVGSNLFDTLAIPAVAALIAPLHFNAGVFQRDTLVLAGASALVTVLLFFTAGINRAAGALLFAGYVIFALITVKGI